MSNPNNQINDKVNIKVSEDREETILKILVDVGNALESLGVLGKQIRERITLIVLKKVIESLNHAEQNFRESEELLKHLLKEGGDKRNG